MADTIVALATPTGRSGIGVVRLSGPNALGIAAKLSLNRASSAEPRVAILVDLFSDDEKIDEALITYFKGPHSFTGENVVEISCHGSPVLLRQVIDLCLANEARLADPGEFTLRALANGRIDLSEAEAIRDLIDAQTTASLRQAVRQMSGEMSRELQPLKDELLNVIVVLESALEFVEDDLPETQTAAIRVSLETISQSAGRLADTFRAGHLIRDGLRVAIIGRPNVGKSSLFNQLLGTERAIVTDIAGTTRDQLHERFVVNDIPISLIDTAGLRDTEDTVESIGVARSRAVANDADLVVILLDAHEGITAEDREIIAGTSALERLAVINKIDAASPDQIDSTISDPALADLARVPISAKTGENLKELKAALLKPFDATAVSAGGFLVTDARHHDLLRRSQGEIDASLDQLDNKMSEEIVLIGLHNALRYLGEITGETTTEDILTRIFATFCIGK